MHFKFFPTSAAPDTNASVVPTLHQRRHDLELLRILALFLLIFYHTGMLYVDGWGFHYKSDYLSSTLANWMLLVNPWRMSLLWFISGVALCYAFKKYGSWYSLHQRSLRLLFPLLFGVLVVVPPQLYIEMAGKGQLPSGFTYLDFYHAFWQLKNPLFDEYKGGILPHMDVNHLWYLRELWKFSVVLIAMLAGTQFLVRKINFHFPERIAALKQSSYWNLQGGQASALLILALIALDVLHLDDRNTTGFLFLLAGYAFALFAGFWQHIWEGRHRYLIAAVLLYLLLLVVYNFLWMVPERKSLPWVDGVAAIVYRLYGGCCIMAALGYAQSFGERFKTFSQRWSEAVLPVYVLHQSLILMAAYWLKPYALGAYVEPVLVILFTVVSCYLLYRLIVRWNLLRVCFGLTWQAPMSAPAPAASDRWVPTVGQQLRRGLAYCLLFPLALKLFV